MTPVSTKPFRLVTYGFANRPVVWSYHTSIAAAKRAGQRSEQKAAYIEARTKENTWEQIPD